MNHHDYSVLHSLPLDLRQTLLDYAFGVFRNSETNNHKGVVGRVLSTSEVKRYCKRSYFKSPF